MPILPINVGRMSSRVKGLKIEKTKWPPKYTQNLLLTPLISILDTLLLILMNRKSHVRILKNVAIFDLEIIFKVKTIKITPVI